MSSGAVIKKEERLAKKEDFLRVRKEGKRLSARHFSVSTAPNGLNIKRLGLSVGARAAGSSPVRNRIKRLVREFFRLNKGFFPEASDTVISARDGIAVKSYADVEKELAATLKKLERTEKKEVR